MLRNLCLALLLLAPGTSQALPLISEAFYDAVGADNGLVFVELFGMPGTNLDGLLLEGVNGSNGAVGPLLALSGVIPADGFFVVADDRGDGASDVANADQVLNFDFQNGPDSIVLRNAGAVIDALAYGVFAPGEIVAGEGSPAPDPVAGSSLARLFANLDTDDNASDFVALDVPTPGTGPLAPIPEPTSAALMATGLVGLACAGRRRQAR
jgi:hypothetical protein